MRNPTSPALATIVLAAALLAPASEAQPHVFAFGAQPQPAYGPVDRTTYTVHAFDIQPANNSIEMGLQGPILRYISSAPADTATLYGGAHLPSGAVLDSISLFACDDSDENNLIASLYKCSDPNGPCEQIGSSAATAGASGCVSPSAALGGATVDNLQSYLVVLQAGVGTSNRFRSIRIEYHLQVSPDPAIQSFTDVPVSHPFHRYVEALYDAGITSGYPNGSFGVDDPITRGQMAVFLSLALGLHFPN